MPTNPLQASLSTSQPYELEVDSAPPLVIFSAADFLQGPPPARKYLLDDVLPLGEVGMVAGPSGIGKSMFILQLGLAVNTGKSVCNGLYSVATTGGVLVVNAEDDKEEIHRRVWHLAHGLPKSSCGDALNCTGDPPLNVMKNAASMKFCSLKGQSASFIEEYGEVSQVYKQVLDAASQITDLRLIVLDPLRRMYDGNEDSSDTAARLIPLMEKLAKDTGATVLLVHHLSKQSARQGSLDQYSAKGSGAFTDLVRWQLNIAQPKNLDGTGLPKDRKHEYLEVCVSKNNYGPPQAERLFLHRGDKGVLRYVYPSGHQDKLDEDVAQVLAVVKTQYEKGKVYSRTELKKQSGVLGITLSQSSLRKAINRAIEQGQLEEVSRPQHQAKGKVPKDLLPHGASHPSMECN